VKVLVEFESVLDSCTKLDRVLQQRGGDKVGRKIFRDGKFVHGGWFTISRPGIYNDSVLGFGSSREALCILVFLYEL
jgi:hypothetical protein